MNLIGKTSINPLLFYSGKIAGYCTWLLLVLGILNVPHIRLYACSVCEYTSWVMLGIGGVLTAVSLVNLGKSTRLGLPSEATTLKTGGIYRMSRNPMYVGFDLFTLSSIMYTMNPLVLIAGVYSIIVYHLIILGEEGFLVRRFGRAYEEYRKKVRRYL